MTQCVWTVGISHSPHKRDGADRFSKLTGNLCCQILYHKKTFLLQNVQYSRAGEGKENRHKWLKWGENAAKVDAGEEECSYPPSSSPSSPFRLPFDGWAHQWEIIRTNCSLVLRYASSPESGGQALKAGEAVSLYFCRRRRCAPRTASSRVINPAALSGIGRRQAARIAYLMSS